MIFFVIFGVGAYAGRISRAIDIINCPGRCWEKNNEICTPLAGKESIIEF